jgi:serine/threonine protein kinase
MEQHTLENSQPPCIIGYTYCAPLGVGSFGSVFHYIQDFPKRDVAVKVFKNAGHLIHNQSIREQSMKLDQDVKCDFMREVNVISKISDHPNITTIYNAGISLDGRYFMVSELGSSDLKKDPCRTASQLDILICEIGSALETTHQSGILHRDIKPSNILHGKYGYLLSDFGISTSTFYPIQKQAYTPKYAPSEVVNYNLTSEQSDIYSFSITLIEQLKFVHLPKEARDKLSKILKNGSSKNPSRRPSKIRYLTEDLQGALSGAC